MYEKYFGFATQPFSATPNPRFLFSSPCHRDAMAGLCYAIQQRRGFVMLVGEVGTGKTTLLRTLLEQIDVSSRTALIHHTTVGPDELLRMVLHELRIDDTSRSRVEVLRSINEFVLAEARANRPPPVLIVDEAHNLPADALEELRLLSNLERSDEKLLQVVLSGQPELEHRLDRPELRQLRQRIAFCARLRPLDAAETAKYIRHRMKVAGNDAANPFTRGALREIWKASSGIPRTINHVCDLSLVHAFGAQRRNVDRALVQEAVEPLFRVAAPPPPAVEPGPRRRGRGVRRWTVLAAAMALIIVFGGLSLLALRETSTGVPDPEPPPVRVPRPAETLQLPPQSPVELPVETEPAEQPPALPQPSRPRPRPKRREAPPEPPPDDPVASEVAAPVYLPPIPVERSPPVVPAIEGGLTAEAVIPVRLLIDENGSVIRSEVDRDIHPELARAAVDAATRWRFRPATEDGRPVAAWTTVRFNFGGG